MYSKFIEQNSNEISGVLVGSNTLGQDAANRSQTEVHERSLDYKISQADRRDIAFNVNDDLLPMLKNQGYSYISDDDIFEWIESKEEIDLIQYWGIVQGLMQNYEVEQDWLSETFNIPITGKKQYTPQSEVAIQQAIFKAISTLSLDDTKQKNNSSKTKPWQRDYNS